MRPDLILLMFMLCASRAAGALPGESDSLARARDAALVRGERMMAKEIEGRIQELRLREQPATAAAPQVVVVRPEESTGGDGPDVVVDTGRFVTFATDYEMDGTMWTLAHNQLTMLTHLYRSTDHGSNWQELNRFYIHPQEPVLKVGLVVGEADSAFVHCFLLQPRNNGDLWLARFTRAGAARSTHAVRVGPDTIVDFSVCRDYTGWNYWLYAFTTSGSRSEFMGRYVFRSADYGKNWLQMDSLRGDVSGIGEPKLAAGAGSWIYLSGRDGYNGIVRYFSRVYGSTGTWVRHIRIYDTCEIAGPVIAPAFTLPETLATVWQVWSYNYCNRGDWDIRFAVSTDGGVNWPSWYSLYSSEGLERFVDLKNFTSLGNPYVNVSYIVEDARRRRIHMHYAHAADPTSWSDSIVVNEHSAGTGYEVTPQLVYSPGSPGPGPGCAFTGEGLFNLYWNSPWTVAGMQQRPGTRGIAARRLTAMPNPAAGPVRFTGVGSTGELQVFDRTGRLVRRLRVKGRECTWDLAGADGRAACPGVYVVRAPGLGSASVRVVKAGGS